MFPRIAGVKIENSWGKPGTALVSCTARLTRPLTAREAGRLLKSIPIDVRGDLLRYDCRAEEVEDFEDRLLEVLLEITGRQSTAQGKRKAVPPLSLRPLVS